MSEFARVPVDGGQLGGHLWPARDRDAPFVLGLHGITANSLSWSRVAHHMAGEATLFAPDLRGRAASAHIGGPYGIAAHAADLRRVLDAFDVDRAVLAGHSMGGYVAARAAANDPDRFPAAVLVDGGVAFASPAAEDVDATLEAVLGPALRRLDMTFPDVESYRDYWRAHPAFGSTWPSWVDDYLRHDLVGEPPELRSSCVRDAVRTDGADVLTDSATRAAVGGLGPPSVLLWAPRGLADEPGGLYDERHLAAADLGIETVHVPDVNHYTLLLGDSGAAAVAEHIRSVTAAVG